MALMVKSRRSKSSASVTFGLKLKLKPLYPLPVLISARASAYSSRVTGSKNTGKLLPTCLNPLLNISSAVEPTTT